MSLHVKSDEVPEYNRVQSGEAGTGAMVVTQRLRQRVQPDDRNAAARLSHQAAPA